MSVLVRSRLRRVKIDQSRLTRVAEAALSMIGERTADSGVLLIGDRSMRRLNRQYRKKDRTTDVLAFSMREVPAPPPSTLIGDVVISIPTAAKQANQLGRSLDEELIALLVHGILHLCGYDHERSERDARRMRQRERWVLRRLGRIPRLVRRNG